MPNGTSGRPLAVDLANRCESPNRLGHRCGNAAMEGTKLCGQHLGRADPKKAARTADRLLHLTTLALDRLEEIILTGSDDVAERAARTVLDRTAPKPGPQHAVIVNVGGGEPIDNVTKSPSEVIAARLEQLAITAARPDDGEIHYTAADLAPPAVEQTESDYAPTDDTVIEAEIVPDPVPPVVGRVVMSGVRDRSRPSGDVGLIARRRGGGW